MIPWPGLSTNDKCDTSLSKVDNLLFLMLMHPNNKGKKPPWKVGNLFVLWPAYKLLPSTKYTFKQGQPTFSAQQKCPEWVGNPLDLLRGFCTYIPPFFSEFTP